MSAPDDESPFSFPQIGGLFEEMQRFQRQLADAEAIADASEVEGSAGGGAVLVRAAGEFHFTSVRIDPAVLEGSDVTLVEDLVLAALNDATTKLLALRRDAMGRAVGGALSALLAEESDAQEPADIEESDDGPV